MGRPLSSKLWRVWAGLAGATWGLGLVRLIAEAGLSSLLYRSSLATAGVALCCAAATTALWSLFSRRSPELLDSSRAALIPLAFPLPYVVGLAPSPLAGGVLVVGGMALATLVVASERSRWLPPVALGLAAFVLYLRTLLPSIGQADTFEFQTVVPLLRVAHPTGYPLYILLTKVFTLLPIGTVAWRVNLASAVYAAAAAAALYGLVHDLVLRSGLALERPWLPALLAALAFACSATFWSQAVIAEVYTLHNVFVAAVLWLLLSFPKIGVARRWQAIFLLLGLGCANHLTTVLLVPAVGLALLWERPRLRVCEWMVAGLGLLLGLSVYSFVLLRWPALNRGEWMSLRDFVAYVTGGRFHGALQWGGWRDLVRWAIVGRLLRETFGWAGWGLALAGAIGLALRGRRALALTGVTLTVFVFYGLSYNVPDISVFLIPAQLVLAIWAGVGVASVAKGTVWLLGRRLGGARRFLALASMLALALLPLCLIWRNLPAVDQSRSTGREAWGRDVLSLPLASGSAILADMDKFAPLYYLQQIEGLRPDVDIVVLSDEEAYRADLAARLGCGQVVYLARYLPRLEAYTLRSVGPLVEVNAALSKDQAEGVPVGALFGETVELTAFDMLIGQVAADAPRGLTLYWRAATQPQADLTVRLRLVDDAGREVWSSVGARPVGGLYPTNAWPVGVVIADYHEIVPPPWLAPGAYHLQVGLFPPFGEEGLAVNGQETPWLTLGMVDVAPADAPGPLPRAMRFLFDGGVWMTGYDLADEAVAGAPFAIDLAWSRVEMTEEVRLAWSDAQGRVVGAERFLLAAGMARSRYMLAAPADPGVYSLRVGLAGRAVRCRWLAPPAEDCPFSVVVVRPDQAGLANFAGRVLLVDARVGRESAQPGEAISVALRWQGLRVMREDYTVFVQLIGPDGRLYGQVDAWPVQGTRPTSGWSPGEVVNDLYEVRLASDAPPGRYQVIAGWYLLATMERLPMVNLDGRSIGDAFVVGYVQVGGSE